MRLRQILLAECLGTFMLVFAGAGSIIFNDLSGGSIGHVGVALTFGFVVLSVIYTFGDVSGAHINPAVTVGFWLAQRFSKERVIPYILAQCLGAVLASICLSFFSPDHATLGATLPSGLVIHSFVIEVILTWWLMLSILHVSEGAKEKGIVAGVVIGLVIALEALFAGLITGASMNPARSLGPALVSGQLETLWLYMIAPLIGVLIAVLTCRFIQGGQCCREQATCD